MLYEVITNLNDRRGAPRGVPRPFFRSLPFRGIAAIVRPMRTIQVVNVRFFNATAWYGFYLARLLREAGHETLVVGLPGTESFGVAEAWGLSPIPMGLNTNNPLRMAALLGDINRNNFV